MKYLKNFKRLDYINYICDIFCRLLWLVCFVVFAFICLSALLIENNIITGYTDISDFISNCRILTINGATNDYLTSLNLKQVYFLCSFCWIIPYWIIDTLFNFPYIKEGDADEEETKQ